MNVRESDTALKLDQHSSAKRRPITRTGKSCNTSAGEQSVIFFFAIIRVTGQGLVLFFIFIDGIRQQQTTRYALPGTSICERFHLAHTSNLQVTLDFLTLPGGENITKKRNHSTYYTSTTTVLL